MHLLRCFSLCLILGISQWSPILAAVCGVFNPCMNGATCRDTPQGDDFTCACPYGFTGLVCNVRAQTTTTTTTTASPATNVNSLPHACPFNPCRNGGFCVATGTDYACFCPTTSSGVLCETESSPLPGAAVPAAPCPFNPCKNAGFCVSAGPDFKCFCQATHTGDTCDTQVTTTSPLVTTTPPFVTMTTASTSVTVQYSHCKADIQFLVDASGSIGSKNFQTQLTFVSDLVTSIFAGSHDVRIGLTTFDSVVHNQFYMNAFNTVQAIVHRITSTSYSAGSTHTDLALQFARTTAFAAGNGDRPGVANIVILITDGRSSDQAKTSSEAAKLRQANVQTISVGVGNGADKAELTLIAGSSGHVYTVSDFDALSNVQNDVLTSACGGNSG